MAEAMGIWHGMRKALERANLNIEVESDRKVVVEALRRKTRDEVILFAIIEGVLKVEMASEVCDGDSDGGWYGDRRDNSDWIGWVIEWGEGYCNEDTKGKPSSKSSEVHTDNLGVQRSEQLRKLYESMLEGKLCEQGKKKTSATLSLEDLSDLEWYYLLCMSFTFKYGQSLPGRAYSTGQHIWLCDAQTTDTDVFTRSLLAKTVICFPHMGGVIELGSTNLISEDLKLIEDIVMTPRDVIKPVCSQLDSSSTVHSRNHLVDIIPNIDFTEDHMFSKEIENAVNQEDMNICSMDSSETLNLDIHYKTGMDRIIGDQNRFNSGYLFGVPFSGAFRYSESLMVQENDDNLKKPQHYGLQELHSTEQDRIDNVPLYASEERRELEELEGRQNGLDFGMDSESSSAANGLDKAIEADLMELLDIEVRFVNDEVQVEMSCVLREYLLLDILKTLHNLNLDTLTVQSSTYGGALFLSLKAKFRGTAFASEGMIKQALRRITSMY
ncbi:transcription factor EGL1-like [Silene latifolia]|uniref:transcription factor EGL1-like n=1 Tax=Silene latifolia TaxID=37657 RepID=UPI003D771C2D